MVLIKIFNGMVWEFKKVAYVYQLKKFLSMLVPLKHWVLKYLLEIMFSRWLEARWLFWRASDAIIFTTWRIVWLQDKWRLLQIQMMIAPDFDIWDSNIQEKSLCKLLQSMIYWKVSKHANWIFVNIASSKRRPHWNSAPWLTAPRRFWIMFTLTFGNLPRLYPLEVTTTLWLSWWLF